MKISLSFLDGTTREVELVRPPRYVLWRHGRSAKTFSHRVEEIAAASKGEEVEPDVEEQGLRLLESMTEQEAVKFQAFADDVVRHATEPRVKVDELTEISYWTVFGHLFYSKPNTPVETKEGETDIKAVESFPQESELLPVSAEMSNIRTVTRPADGDSVPTSG